MLRASLDKRSVAVGAEADGGWAAVEKSGRLLFSSGAAENHYGADMVPTAEELGPYSVTAPGVTLAHARSEIVEKVGATVAEARVAPMLVPKISSLVGCAIGNSQKSTESSEVPRSLSFFRDSPISVTNYLEAR